MLLLLLGLVVLLLLLLILLLHVRGYVIVWRTHYWLSRLYA